MTKEKIPTLLQDNKSFIQSRFEVDKIGVFGSYARNEHAPDSDIDFYVEFKNKSFRNLAGLWNYLENLYKTKIDIVHKHGNNNPTLIQHIQNEVIFG